MRHPHPPRLLPTAVLTACTAATLLARAPAVQGTLDPLSDAAVSRDISSWVADLGAKERFSGVVVAARHDQPFAVGTAGFADRARRTPITPSTRFTIGSMGKMFTATAVGQLVDRGKLSWNDVVGRFFPDYPNGTVRSQVTVGMLLSHTGGLGDFLARRTPAMMKNGVKRAGEFMPLYSADEPRFAPGSGWSYSNAGFALAGAIVEKVSGEAYPDYIRTHVFQAAGMANSDPNNVPHPDPQLVLPYTKLSAEGPTATWREAPRDIGSPAGGAISTARDLIRYADALRGGRLVSRETFRTLTVPRGTGPGGMRYGYAMEIAAESGRTIVGHGGGFPGVSTHLYIVLDSPYTVVSLANQDSPAAETAARRARALLIEKAARGK